MLPQQPGVYSEGGEEDIFYLGERWGEEVGGWAVRQMRVVKVPREGWAGWDGIAGV
jgi:hypothetical protein